MRLSTRSVSQPEAIVPTMSKTPTRASRLAAVVFGMPWSCAAGMKCVPTRPLVVAPQIANPPASSQNARVLAASRRAVRAVRAAFPVGFAGGSVMPPRAVTPRSCGWSRRRQRISGTTASATPVTISAAVRHPCASVMVERTGRKTRLPVAPPAVSTPVTRPRCLTNQRPVIVATKPSASEPVPSPTSTPQQSMSCQLAFIQMVRPEPSATRPSAAAATRRMPNLAISAAANGAVRP